MVATLPGRTVGLSLVTEPLLADLQISRTHYANCTFWATVIGALFSVACGRVIDRWGVRNTLTLAILLLACSTLAMGFWLAPANLLLLLILARGFGQSSLSTASVTAVGKWFTTHLGIALGVFSAFVALGFAVAIPVLGGIITPENWRDRWVSVGFILVALSGVAFALIPANDRTNPNMDQLNHPSTSWGRALRSPAFWMFTTSTSLYYLVLSGLTLFSEAVVAELGFDHNVFIAAMAAMMGAGLIGNFLAGWLSVRILVPRLLSFSLLILAGVLFGLPLLNSAGQVILLFAVYGVCGGAFAVLFFAGYGQAFGQLHLGKIQGTAQVLGVVASAIGPKMIAETEDSTGSHLAAFTWLGPVAVAFAIAAWWTPMPCPGEPAAD
jgi:MFS family permease